MERRWRCVFSHDNTADFGLGTIEASPPTAVLVANCVPLSNHDGAAGRVSVKGSTIRIKCNREQPESGSCAHQHREIAPTMVLCEHPRGN